jgi:hypothetical protein
LGTLAFAIADLKYPGRKKNVRPDEGHVSSSFGFSLRKQLIQVERDTDVASPNTPLLPLRLNLDRIAIVVEI